MNFSHEEVYELAVQISREPREEKAFCLEIDGLSLQTGANCSDQPHELFVNPSGEELLIVRKICAACPVNIACLVFGLKFATGQHDEKDIYGGATYDERVAIKAKYTNITELGSVSLLQFVTAA